MKPRFLVSLRTVLLLGFVGLVLVSSGTMLAIGAWTGNTSAQELLLQRSAAVLQGLEGWVRTQLDPLRRVAERTRDLVDRGVLDVADTNSLDAYILGAMAGTPRLEGLAVITPDLRARRYGRGQAPLSEDWSDRPAVAGMVAAILDRAAAGDPEAEWGHPVWRGPVGHAAFNIRVPLMRDGAPAGVLLAMVSLDPIGSILPRLLSSDVLTPYALYGRDRVIAHPLLDPGAAFDDDDAPAVDPGGAPSPARSLPELGAFPDLHLAMLWSAEPMTLSGPVDLKPGWARGIRLPGTEVIHTLREITGLTPEPILVGTHFTPQQGARAFVRLWYGIGVGLTVLAVSAVGAVLLARWIGRPVQRFAVVARRVAAGDLSQDETISTSWIREYREGNEAVRGMIRGLRERERVRALFGKYVPEEVARRLLAEDGEARPDRAEATILIADLVAFTRLTEDLGPDATVRVMNAYFSAMVDILEDRGGVVTQFQGDAMLVVFNLPERHSEHAAAAVRAAQAMVARLDAGPIEGQALTCRIGIGTGMVMAGAVGARDRLSYTVHGDAVNLASRLEAMNKSMGTRILVCERTASLAGGIRFLSLGTVRVRGQGQEQHVFTPAEGGRAPDPA
jgi:class 3 adenylate cyclase